jgi:anti-anti-sigma factor
MQIDERVVDGVTILDLKGKMTLGEGDELLKDKINSLIQQDRKQLVLNLEAVPYIDSAGLGEIVRTYTTVSRQGGKLKLLNLTKRITDLLAITKLLTVFETYESESDAVKSFSSADRPPATLPAALNCRPNGATCTVPHIPFHTIDRAEPGPGATAPARARVPSACCSPSPRPVDEEPHHLRRPDLRRPAARARGRRHGGDGVRDLLRAVGRGLPVNDVPTGRRTGSTRSSASGRLPRGRSRWPSRRDCRGCSAVGALASAFWLQMEFGGSVGGYLALLALYSGPLKHTVIIDVITIAIGFVLRAVAGAVVIGVAISHWLLILTILLALFLALSKRRHELVLLAEGATSHRPILQEYSPYLLDQMISVVTASTIVAYAFYTVSPEVIEKFGTDQTRLTLPFPLYGIFRYLYLVHQKEGGGSPAEMLLTDRPLLVCVALWAAGGGAHHLRPAQLCPV